MIPVKKKARSQLIKETFTRGGRITSPYFTLRFLKIPGTGSLYSVIVPSSIARKPTQRNALKRRLYAALPSFLLPSGGYCIVFILKKEGKNLSVKQYREEIEKVLKNLSSH